MTLEQIRRAVAGRIDGPTPAVQIKSISTDTRKIAAGGLFIAIVGETLDGHDYLAQARAAGAVAAIVEARQLVIPAGLHCIVVPNTRRALGQLAQWVRCRFAGKVIAVAGSNGKTGTKRLIDAALKPALRGTISPKSFNNDIGVPLSIFAAGEKDDYLVLEVGTNHPGEIATLSDIALPDIAVITNCSAEHLEGLSDLDGVRRENAAITAGLSADGLLIVNGDDADLLDAVEPWRGQRLTFGFSESNDLWAADVGCDASGTRFMLNGQLEVFVPLLGRHIAANAVAAIAVGRRLCVADNRIVAGLARATGPEMRLELQQHAGVAVLNDAYNANPASMQAALETLCALPASGRRVAVLGDMRELGQWTEKLHRELGAAAAKCKLDRLICVGGSAALIGQAAQAAGMSGERVSFHGDADAAAGPVAHWVRSGDLILLKGSRAVGLEKIAQAIGQG